MKRKLTTQIFVTSFTAKNSAESDRPKNTHSNYNRIDLNRIINTEQLSINEQGIIRLIFQMEAESTPEEKRVGQHLFFLSELNADIQIASTEERIEIEEPNPEEAYLYTVNVGCALTNFLVLVEKEQTEVWSIDWGSGRYYKAEAEQFIKDCIEDIKTSFFCGNKFMISKLFISHADTDHYNRIDVSMIDNNTEVWVSGYNFIAGQFLNKLNQISSKTSKFKMPVCYNSSGKIKVLHPNQPIVYGTRTFWRTGFYLARNKNDVSPILEIDINNTKCVFPGDISKQGWMWYKSCSGNKKIKTDIYLHSHHGSINGFITNIPNPLDCEYDTVSYSIDILSTRDNAYPGSIPSHDITSNPQYKNTKSTQLAPRELRYYKTDIIRKKVTPVYV